MAEDTVHNLDAAINQRPFWLWRGRAVTAYASLEQALCLLFSVLTGIPTDISGLVFFKITSARSRNALIEELLRTRGYYEPYKVFWKDYLSKIGSLDQRRNEIVHWAEVAEIDTSDPKQPRVTFQLVPAKYGIALSATMRDNAG